jgi:hypothetical protein
MKMILIFLAFLTLDTLLTAPPSLEQQVSQQSQRDDSMAIPANSVFSPPQENSCRSSYDRFYTSEPGVYAYWALCEGGIDPRTFDYAGSFDFDEVHGAWHRGRIMGTEIGPVGDGETAYRVLSTEPGRATAQDIVLNKNTGTLAAWVKSISLAPNWMAIPFSLSAVDGRSSVELILWSKNNSVCVGAGWQNSLTQRFGSATNGDVWAPDARCGLALNTWHRIVETWGSGVVRIYVDGLIARTARYQGQLDDSPFFYELFSVQSDTSMALAKVTLANRVWNQEQVDLDIAPEFDEIPRGGVLISNKRLGVIHGDILGIADDNADLSSLARVTALEHGLTKAGVTALRYANGFGGADADRENWRGGRPCPSRPMSAVSANDQPQNLASQNNLDRYLTAIAKQLNLHVGFTVNYGSNPPLCNAGGDPDENGAQLVSYANHQKHYAIRYWEIGNETYSKTTELDLHPSPHTGASYARYEPAFFKKMKSADPSILVGIPIAVGNHDWLENFTFPAMKSAKFDAVIWHNYPTRNPVSDGSTLYNDRVKTNASRTRGQLLLLQTLLLNFSKNPDSIWVTEWNDDVGGNQWSRQSMGAAIPLFATMQLAEYMRAGVQFATWWAQGMSAACMTYYYDPSGDQTYSWWNCGGLPLTYCGAVPGALDVGLRGGDLTPVGRAFQLLSESGFVREKEHILSTQTDDLNAPWLVAYGATHLKSFGVIIINRDRDSAHVVPVRFRDRTSGSSVTAWSYGRAQFDQTRRGDWESGPLRKTYGSWSKEFDARVEPWSINVLIFE